jgi:hypothetical protein
MNSMMVPFSDPENGQFAGEKAWDPRPLGAAMDWSAFVQTQRSTATTGHGPCPLVRPRPSPAAGL